MEAVKYFEQTSNYFWEWLDQGEYVSISAGDTVAHIEIVKQVITQLSYQGLPKFSSILLSLIALNQNAETNINRIEGLVETIFSHDLGSEYQEQFKPDVFKFLRVVSQLPKEFRTGEKRLLVLKAIFWQCHNIISTPKSTRIAEILLTNRLLLRTVTSDDIIKFVNQDLRQLELLAVKFKSIEDIIDAIAKLPDVDEEMTLFEKEEDEKISSEEYVETLVDDYKTFAVGALVKRLWSGLNIPLHSDAPNQMPLGGVSDLTNKGDFHQLLISEYANDDILFLSRLANNEALYLEREAPPTDTKEERIILIDSSIKNWGTPKTIAFAIAIALAHHPRNKVDYHAYIIGENTTLVALNNKTSLIDGLQLLSGRLHIAESLTAFLEQEKNKKEIILITEKSYSKQAPMLEVLHNNQAEIDFLVETDNEGVINIFKKSRSGKKHLQKICLPLDKLWEKKPSKKNIVHPYNFTNEYSILFDAPSNHSSILSTNDGTIYLISKDKKLFKKSAHYRTNEKGWQLVRENLPIGSGHFEVGSTTQGEDILLLFNNHNETLYLINLSTNDQSNFIFPYWHSGSPYFIFHNNSFTHHDWNISPEWKLNKAEPLEYHFIESRLEELKDASLKHHIFNNVLRNIKQIRISNEHRLIINKHELLLKDNQYFKIEFCKKRNEFQLEAEQVEENIFQFQDGSTILVNKAGMLTLISSNNNLPTIYIPTTIDITIGLGTGEYFSGREFYKKEVFQKVYFEQTGIRKSDFVGILNSLFFIETHTAHLIIDKGFLFVPESKMEEFSNFILETCPEDFRITEVQRSELDNSQIDMLPAQFYDFYIKSFINNILSHATSN